MTVILSCNLIRKCNKMVKIMAIFNKILQKHLCTCQNKIWSDILHLGLSKSALMIIYYSRNSSSNTEFNFYLIAVPGQLKSVQWPVSASVVHCLVIRNTFNSSFTVCCKNNDPLFFYHKFFFSVTILKSKSWKSQQ